MFGGNNFDTNRLANAQYQKYVEEVKPFLGSLFTGLHWAIVPHYGDKKDFGDLDIVVKANVDEVNGRLNAFLHIFPGNRKTNDGIISLEHNEFQVDFVCAPNNYQQELDYLSYNAIGELIGKLANKMNLKYGDRGLFFILKDEKNEANTRDLLVSDDTEKIFQFFGLDHKAWKNGFETIDEMFSWFTSAGKFDATTFDEEFLSPAIRQKNRKRKTFSAFMAWLEKHDPQSNFTFVAKDKRHLYVPDIEQAFGKNLNIENEKFQADMNAQRARALKFNGEIAMEITKFRGKQLGDFIASFRTYIEEMKPFDDYLDSRSSETIRTDVKDFFKEEYAVKSK